MVHLFFTEVEARALLALCRAHGQADAVAEIEVGVGRPCSAVPAVDILPTLSVWYRGQAVHYFDDDLADAMYAGLSAAADQRRARDRVTVPLFAALGEAGV